ncbi:hypothetical protein [Eubacterium callanderi]|uniref:Uncharacterized protein n=1 Tax=Eubacterium callanderi TaxID=53442 RepID=A0A853JKA1_9FIRM|nr:hypothetical protein [Eubacterium callanderi]
MQWKPGGIPPGTPSGTKPVSSDSDINNKYINTKSIPGYADTNPNGFNIPPKLTEEEERQLEAAYPDPVERFWAGMALRDQKAEEEKAWEF